MPSDKGTRYSKQLVTKAESPLRLENFVPPPDMKTQKPSGKNGNVFPNQMQVHQPLGVRGTEHSLNYMQNI